MLEGYCKNLTVVASSRNFRLPTAGDGLSTRNVRTTAPAPGLLDARPLTCGYADIQRPWQVHWKASVNPDRTLARVRADPAPRCGTRTRCGGSWRKNCPRETAGSSPASCSPSINSANMQAIATSGSVLRAGREQLGIWSARSASRSRLVAGGTPSLVLYCSATAWFPRSPSRPCHTGRGAAGCTWVVMLCLFFFAVRGPDGRSRLR